MSSLAKRIAQGAKKIPQVGSRTLRKTPRRKWPSESSRSTKADRAASHKDKMDYKYRGVPRIKSVTTGKVSAPKSK